MTFKQVDISSKPIVYREATATGRIRLKSSTVRLIRVGKLEKGDPLSLAKLTGILAAKQTPSLLPLCHPLRIEKTEVRTKVGDESVEVSVTVSAREKTGVEMEALTAATVAALTIYDMCKAIDKAMTIGEVRLLEKSKEPA